MPITLFDNLTAKNKADAIENLICESSPRQDFFLMILLSILMATFGLLIGNVSVVIGSMLIAPMLYPVISLSLGIELADTKLISRSIYTIFKSMSFGIAASALVTLFFGVAEADSQKLIEGMAPSLPYTAIAIVSGLAVSFAMLKPQLSETLPGVAISVALVPPLAVIGIGIARLDWEIIRNSFLLFSINIAGIVFASLVVFSMMNLYLKRTVAKETVKKEEEAMEKEREKARNNGKK